MWNTKSDSGKHCRGKTKCLWPSVRLSQSLIKVSLIPSGPPTHFSKSWDPLDNWGRAGKRKRGPRVSLGQVSSQTWRQRSRRKQTAPACVTFQHVLVRPCVATSKCKPVPNRTTPPPLPPLPSFLLNKCTVETHVRGCSPSVVRSHILNQDPGLAWSPVHCVADVQSFLLSVPPHFKMKDDANLMRDKVTWKITTNSTASRHWKHLPLMYGIWALIKTISE